MREILFRGKRLNKGGWVYGDLSFHVQDGIPHIFPANGYDSTDCYEVKPATVGQYTGLTDKNGVKIFEGDILAVKGHEGRFEVWWSSGNCGFVAGHGVHMRPNMNQATIDAYEIIGNIHDHTPV